MHEACADDTGLKTATAIVSAGTGWTTFTVGQINSSNNQYATNSTSNAYGVISTFAFGIASEKIIDGIEVQFEGSSSTATAVAYAAQLSWNAGASWTTAKVGAFTGTTDATPSLGGVGDNWGRTWTASELSDANFQLRVYKTGGTPSLRVDRIQVKVYYTAFPEKVIYNTGTSGTSWVVPTGITSITVKAWGGGGGGGGGQYTYSGGSGAAPGSHAPLSRSPPAKRSPSGWAAAARGDGGWSNAGSGGGGGGGYSGVFRSQHAVDHRRRRRRRGRRRRQRG